MRLSIFSLLVLSLVLFGSGCKRSPVLAKVGGTKITEAELGVLGEINPRLKPRLSTPSGRQKILENYVEQTLLYREATSRGLHRSNDTKRKLDLYRKIIIAQAALDDELNKKVKEYYDNHKDEFERVSLSHILVRTVADEGAKAKNKAAKKPVAKRSEAEALKLAEKARERLLKGEDFGKVASELSEDARTRQNQGSLGFVTIRDKRLERDGWLPLAENGFSLKEGEVSAPIKTKDGFHLVRITEGKKMQPIEEADPMIRFRIQQEVRTSLLEGLKKKHKVAYVTEQGVEPPPTEPEISRETPPPAPPPGGGTPPAPVAPSVPATP